MLPHAHALGHGTGMHASGRSPLDKTRSVASQPCGLLTNTMHCVCVLSLGAPITTTDLDRELATECNNSTINHVLLHMVSTLYLSTSALPVYVLCQYTEYSL